MALAARGTGRRTNRPFRISRRWFRRSMRNTLKVMQLLIRGMFKINYNSNQAGRKRANWKLTSARTLIIRRWWTRSMMKLKMSRSIKTSQASKTYSTIITPIRIDFSWNGMLRPIMVRGLELAILWVLLMCIGVIHRLLISMINRYRIWGIWTHLHINRKVEAISARWKTSCH